MYIKIFHNILLLSCFTLSTRNHFVHISYILKPEGNVACYASTSSFLLSVIRFRSNGRELSSSFHLSPHKRKKNSWVSTLPEPSRRRRHREICALSCYGASSPSEMCLRRRHARVNGLAAASRARTCYCVCAPPLLPPHRPAPWWLPWSHSHLSRRSAFSPPEIPLLVLAATPA
jgi:hypothetical protein